MTTIKSIKRATLGTVLAAALAAGLATTVPFRAMAQPARAVSPTNDITLSVGTGRLVQLNGTMSDLFVANDAIADVQVRSPSQIYIFGKTQGSTTVYATDRTGRVVYSANVRVGQNLGSVDEMLNLAMPEAQIRATPMNGLVLLTGTVAQPEDAAEAERLVQSFVGQNTQVVSRLRTATPQQVMLRVTIAEVSRSLVRQIGVNLETFDPTGGTLFGITRGRDVATIDATAGTVSFSRPAQGSSVGVFLQDILGLNVASSVDLNENNGLVTILAEPTLTALSGETASFLAGGEFPIPVSQSLGAVTIEYKQFGVGLAFTPIVLEDGRISMRVRPEVSELSSEGSIRLNGFEVPALVTRRSETTIELGSGQSMVIAGLLRNGGNNSIERTPFLGSLPIIGALFRSNSFRRNETELVIVATPYLVRPVSANQIALPTDGYRNANDAQRVLLGQDHGSRNSDPRPLPASAAPRTVAPGVGQIGSADPATPQPPVQEAQRPPALPPRQTAANAQPGFEFR
jgi:pilus assembly protein CpaC